KYFDVILGLNEKETHEVGEVLSLNTTDRSPEGLSALAISIHAKLPINTLVVHPTHYALAVSDGKVSLCQGAFTPKPLITTGARIESVTPEIKNLIANMFETMYAHKGVGLAAQQVSVAQQLTVIDVRGVTDRPSTLELDGKPADVRDFMPLVLINPEVKPVGK